MATEIAKAYVQIIPSVDGMKSKLQSAMGGEVTSAGDSAGKSIGGSMVSAIKGVVAAAGIGTFVKQALDAGGALQQSFGGLDTIYEDASAAAKEYANAAAQAGISANDYAEQAVSFGASLKMAFGGDTTKAVEAANTAIMDMTDNAAKMGTPIESIQNAYQGFAKQNYTMLDNLKLGYGGTQKEMERLLADAEKISGVKYDIGNLGDVYDAIHVIQGELGLTGVAAQEASETFSGSLGAVKASFENLLGSLTTGENIYTPLQTLFKNIKVFVGNNLIPMLESILSDVPQLVANLISEIGSSLSEASGGASEFVDFGINLIGNLIDGIMQTSGELLKGIWDVIVALGDALIEFDWSGFATDMMHRLKSSLEESAYSMFGDYDANIIDSLLNGITSKLPDVLSKAGEIAKTIQDGIVDSLPLLIDKLGEFIPKVIDFVSQNLPVIFEFLADMLRNAISNLPQILSALFDVVVLVLSNLPALIGAILNGLFVFVDTLLGGFFTNVIEGVQEFLDKPLYYIGVAIGEIIAKVIQFNADIYNKIKEFLTVTIPNVWNGFIDWISELPGKVIDFFKQLPEDLKSIGVDVITGFFNGIKETWENLKSGIKDITSGVVDGFKNAFDIHSPSRVFRDQIGKMLPEGMALGIKENIGVVTDAMDELQNKTTNAISGSAIGYGAIDNMNISRSSYSVQSNTANVGQNQNVGILALLSEYLPQLANMQMVTDTGAMVGVLAPKMDKELGRLAVRSSRYV